MDLTKLIVEKNLKMLEKFQLQVRESLKNIFLIVLPFGETTALHLESISRAVCMLLSVLFMKN